MNGGSCSDLSKAFVGDFRRAWEEVGTDGEVLEKFALQFKKLEDGAYTISSYNIFNNNKVMVYNCIIIII